MVNERALTPLKASWNIESTLEMAASSTEQLAVEINKAVTAAEAVAKGESQALEGALQSLELLKNLQVIQVFDCNEMVCNAPGMLTESMRSGLVR